MSSFNKCILVGNTTRPIELKYTASGMAIAKTGLAVNRKWNDKTTGEKKEEVMFIDIVIFGRAAETANQYIPKGKQILVEGALKLEQWTDQAGQKRSKHLINVDSYQLLGSKEDSGHAPVEDDYNQEYTYENEVKPPKQAQAQTDYKIPDAPSKPLPDVKINDDEIPF